MAITGFSYWYRKQWNKLNYTFDVYCGRSPTMAEASLNMVLDDGYHAVGITQYRTRNTPVSEEQTVDFGPLYWNWPGKVYNQTMTQVTFACGTGPSTQLTGHFQVTFYEF
jgi:hypothetical protein